MTEPTEPAGPEPEQPDLQTQLADALGRAAHFERIVAAVVAASGPVQVSMDGFNTAEPDKLIVVNGLVGGQPVVIYALGEQALTIMSVLST